MSSSKGMLLFECVHSSFTTTSTLKVTQKGVKRGQSMLAHIMALNLLSFSLNVFTLLQWQSWGQSHVVPRHSTCSNCTRELANGSSPNYFVVHASYDVYCWKTSGHFPHVFLCCLQRQLTCSQESPQLIGSVFLPCSGFVAGPLWKMAAMTWATKKCYYIFSACMLCMWLIKLCITN